MFLGAVHVATTNTKTGERIRVTNQARSRSKSPANDLPLHNTDQHGANSSRLSRADHTSRTSNRSNSPPIPTHKHATHRVTGKNSPLPPAIKLKSDTDHNAYNYDSYRGEGLQHPQDGTKIDKNKYSDFDVVGAPVQHGEFVPFIRSTNVLDPAQAEEPLPLSREPSRLQKARQAYVQEHEPARYGTLMENFSDSRIVGKVPPQVPQHYEKVRVNFKFTYS